MVPFFTHSPSVYEMAVIKTRCNPEFKSKVKAFLKKKGETESSIVRKAVNKYIQEDEKN